MDLGAFQAGRAGYTVAIVAPLAVLAAVAIPIGIVQARLEHNLAERQELLSSALHMETALDDARALVARLEVPRSMDVNRVADLNGFVGGLAHDTGVVDQDVSVRRSSGDPSSGQVEYAVAVRGEGTLPVLARFLDGLEHGQRLGGVASVSLHARTLQPEPTYQAELTFVCRDLHPHEAAVPSAKRAATRGLPCPPDLRESLGRAGSALRSSLDRIRKPVDVRSLARQRVAPPAESGEPAAPSANPDVPPEFALKGIVRSSTMPLAITDVGVKAVGDRVGSWKVKAIETDGIVLVSPNGRSLTVRLSSDDKP